MTCSQNMQAVISNPSAADPAKHVKYNLGMVLGVADFVQESTYHITHREWLARDLIGYGTVWGLRVVPEDGGSKGPRVLVECGAALSPRGQLIHVSPAQCGYLNDWLDANRSGIEQQLHHTPASGDRVTIYAVLAYADCETDDVPLAGEPCRTEDHLTARSRIKDHFKLQLRLDLPLQTEEDALRNFVRALALVEIVVGGGGEDTLKAFEEATRNSPVVTSPPSSPPMGSSGSFDYTFAGATIPDDQVQECLRAAFRIWTVELRPRCRPEWLANGGACESGATQTQHPKAEDCILLAGLEVPITVDASTIPNRWSVASASVVDVNDRDRPYLLHLRMLQEWLLGGLEPRPGGSFVQPSERMRPLGRAPFYDVAAAGLVLGNQTAVGPVVGGLRVASVSAGEVLFTFDDYQQPDSSFQYIVKVLPQSAPPRTPVPTVRFLEFRPNGFALKVTRGVANVSVADLQSVPFMLEVSRIG